MSRRFKADLFGILIWLGLFLLLYFAIPYVNIPYWRQLSLAWQIFIELNLATFLLYGFDKLSAQSRLQRMPERILYLATFLGGSIGALLAMNLFRHKTRKTSFQLVIACLILLQIAIVYYWR